MSNDAICLKIEKQKYVGNVVLFKSAVASVLDPDPLLIQAYAESTNQECPLEETPVERLKRAFQEFTESVDANQALD